MAKSDMLLRKNLRENILKDITNYFTEKGEEVLQIKSNEICFPCVDEKGGEWFARIKVEIPTGSRDDKEPFDGYALAEDYRVTNEEKEKKAKENAEKKQKKIKRDEEYRRKKAEIAKKGE